MKGGKREGSGRKRSDQKKVRISTSLSIDVVDYLNSRQDKPKAQIIEDALRQHMHNRNSTGRLIRNVKVELGGKSHDVVAECCAINGNLELKLTEIDGKHTYEWLLKNTQEDYIAINKFVQRDLMDYLALINQA